MPVRASVATDDQATEENRPSQVAAVPASARAATTIAHDQPPHPGAGGGLVDGGDDHEPGIGVEAPRRVADQGAGDRQHCRGAQQERPASARARGAMEVVRRQCDHESRRQTDEPHGADHRRKHGSDRPARLIGKGRRQGDHGGDLRGGDEPSPGAGQVENAIQRRRPVFGARPARSTKSAKIAPPSASA